MAVAGRSMTDRIVGALRLDEETFEDIEADEKATGEAAFIVVASALVAAAGYALRAGGEVNAGLIGAIAELIGWAVFAWFAWLVGTKVFPAPSTRANWSEIARTMGYAHAPRFLLILVAIPGLYGLIRILVSVWILAASVAALRASIDCSTMRAILVGAVATVLQLIVISFLVGILF